MATMVRLRGTVHAWHVLAWLPVGLFPAAAVAVSWSWPAWGRMWILALAIFAAFKWLTFAESRAARKASWSEAASYLFFWIGMDAEQYFASCVTPEKPRRTEWLWSVGQLVIGTWLLVDLGPRLVESWPYVAGWAAMTGVVSILHFGLAHLLSLVWRSNGYSAPPIMEKPGLARSLSEFWGRRWNLAFRDVMHGFVFRPLAPIVGGVWGTVAVFVVSGLIHDAVISYTAGSGWGLPTLYFLIQAAALFVERSRFGRRLGLGRGLIGWLFAVAVVVGPAGLLFHGPFIANVVVPMIEAIGQVRSWT
jgi:hypothetical protein